MNPLQYGKINAIPRLGKHALTRGSKYTVRSDALHGVSFFNGDINKATTRNLKRDAHAMDPDPPSSQKRQRIGRGSKILPTSATAQEQTSVSSAATNLYLDVRDGARTPPGNGLGFELDVWGNDYGRTKRQASVPKIKVPAKPQRPASNGVAGKILRKMAQKYAPPSTPRARIGLTEFRSTQSLLDDLPLTTALSERKIVKNTRASLDGAPGTTKVNTPADRDEDTLNHSKKNKPCLKHNVGCMQPVEHAWAARGTLTSNPSACSLPLDSKSTGDPFTGDAKAATVRAELDSLSKGLTSQSVSSVGNRPVLW